jgi:hypothetical protein
MGLKLDFCLNFALDSVLPCSKVKLPLCLTNQALRHEGVWGNGCIGTSWRWVVSFTPRVDPRADLDDLEKRKYLTLSGLELRSLGRPARSQSLYRLSYRGSPSPCSTRQKSIRMPHHYWRHTRILVENKMRVLLTAGASPSSDKMLMGFLQLFSWLFS